MRRLPSLRWAAALAAVLLGGASVRECRRERAERTALVARWEGTGAALRRPSAASRAARDPDPKASRQALARALYADASDTRGLASLPRAEAAAEAARAERTLVTAGEEAAASLAARPMAWDAAMVLGGTRLLAALRGHEEELYTQPERWRAPLLHAQRLAPGSPEPRRLLVSGYLASWQALSADERTAGRRLLAAAFRDRDTLAQSLPAWAAVASSPAELQSVLPLEPGPYELLQESAARQRDWVSFCSARNRWLALTVAALQARLREAEARLAGGDLQGGRSALLSIATTAPPDRRTAGIFSRAVEELPPGQVSGGQSGALAAWLAWALPLWQLGDEPLPPAVMGRLASIAPDLLPAQAAMAALAGGDLGRAEVFERRADRLWSPDWAAYATSKAEALLARGHADEAAAVLDEVHRIYRERFPYLRAREKLAAARSEPLELRPESLARAVWGGEQWQYRGNEASLEVVAGRSASAIEVAVDVAPEEGAVVEIAWDGASAGCVPVRQMASLRVPVAVTAGPHRLVWRGIAGGRSAPGAVVLVETIEPAAGTR
jgi:hypothetical protein